MTRSYLALLDQSLEEKPENLGHHFVQPLHSADFGDEEDLDHVDGLREVVAVDEEDQEQVDLFGFLDRELGGEDVPADVVDSACLVQREDDRSAELGTHAVGFAGARDDEADDQRLPHGLLDQAPLSQEDCIGVSVRVLVYFVRQVDLVESVNACVVVEDVARDAQVVLVARDHGVSESLARVSVFVRLRENRADLCDQVSRHEVDIFLRLHGLEKVDPLVQLPVFVDCCSSVELECEVQLQQAVQVYFSVCQVDLFSESILTFAEAVHFVDPGLDDFVEDPQEYLHKLV